MPKEVRVYYKNTMADSRNMLADDDDVISRSSLH
jgi:hypothetical protein